MPASSANAPLQIDVVSDIVCPWCLIGKHRLEKAIAMRPDIPVQIRFHPFFLNEWIPREGVTREEYLMARYGPPEKREKGPNRAREAAEAEGLVYDTRKIKRIPHTLDCHRLIYWAGEDKGPAMNQRLIDLYFREGGDLTDIETLVQAAADVGLPPDEIRRKLTSNEDADRIFAAVEATKNMGISGVPFFIFDNALAVSGAQPPEYLAEVMDQALARRDGSSAAS
ncbi:MAG: DsbA family protein [Pseudorhodoplanes sp.]